MRSAGRIFGCEGLGNWRGVMLMLMGLRRLLLLLRSKRLGISISGARILPACKLATGLLLIRLEVVVGGLWARRVSRSNG